MVSVTSKMSVNNVRAIDYITGFHCFRQNAEKQYNGDGYNSCKFQIIISFFILTHFYNRTLPLINYKYNKKNIIYTI